MAKHNKNWWRGLETGIDHTYGGALGDGWGQGFKNNWIPWKAEKPCHNGSIDTGLTVAGTSCKIWAGGSMRACKPYNWYIQTINRGHKGIYISLNMPYNDVLATIDTRSILTQRQLPELHVEWSDGLSSPQILNWDGLRRLLAEYDDCLVACAGGHGRTGTAVALLAFAGNNPDAIKTVRSQYCHKAIETSEQIEEIETVCGVQSDRTISRVYYTGKVVAWDAPEEKPIAAKEKAYCKAESANGLVWDEDVNRWYLNGKML